MSRKGENKKAKAISVPRAIHLSRKEKFWTIKTKAGPHNKENSLPLGLIVRDISKIAQTLREAKHILNNGGVKVNGVVRSDHQFPVGLFDVVAIEKQKVFFRILFDSKGRLIAKLVEKKSKEKISKVTNKVMTSKGIQITTTDSRTFFGVDANVGDSLIIKLPEGKVGPIIKFEEGAIAYLTKGAHCAQNATIKQIVQGTARKAKLVKLSTGKKEFETIANNVFVIGKGKVAIDELE